MVKTKAAAPAKKRDRDTAARGSSDAAPPSPVKPARRKSVSPPPSAAKRKKQSRPVSEDDDEGPVPETPGEEDHKGPEPVAAPKPTPKPTPKEAAPEPAPARPLPTWAWVDTVAEMARDMASSAPHTPVPGTPVPGTPMPGVEAVILENTATCQDLVNTVAAMGGDMDAMRRACDEFKPGMGEVAVSFFAAAFLLVECTTDVMTAARNLPPAVKAWWKGGVRDETAALTAADLERYIEDGGDGDSLSSSAPIPFEHVLETPKTKALGVLVFKCACTLIAEEWDM